MLQIKSKNANYGINIPTTPEEITKEALEGLVKNVVIPKYFCIIALRYRVKLFELCMTSRSSNKKGLVSVVPLLAKFNKEEMKMDAEVGDRVIIDGSSIERGSHLNVATGITPERITSYITNDEELNKASINRSITKGSDDTIYCLEFKIVPLNDIKGIIKGDNEDIFTSK